MLIGSLDIGGTKAGTSTVDRIYVGSALVFGTGPSDTAMLYPSDAFVAGGFVDITQSPYSADPTGVVDATAAIQDACDDVAAALESSAVMNAGTVFFPEGTYKVSNSIFPAGSSVRLLGAHKNLTTIRLANNSAGFGAGADKYVYRPGNDGGGGANQAFADYVQHLTIEIGSGNPGAVGMYFDAANSGAFEHVRIIAPNGGSQGVVFAGPTGNAYARDIEIDGFDTGMWGDSQIANCFPMDDIVIKNCDVAIELGKKNLQFVGLTVENCPTVLTADVGGAALIVNGTFTGGAGGPCIDVPVNAWLHLRNITATGWDRIVDVGAPQHFVGETSIAEWGTKAYFIGETETAWSENLTEPISFALPIEPHPEYHTNDFDKWANVKDFGAVSDGSTNATAAIQDAIDSGAEIVYFPRSIAGYNIAGTVIVRNACRRIDFMFSTLLGSGAFSMQNGTSPEVLLENFDSVAGNSPNLIKATTRTVAIRNGRPLAMPVTCTASGKLFVSNLGPQCSINVSSGATAWLRQIDTGGTVTITVNGATCWVLGDNYEGLDQLMRNRVVTNGGVLEVLGGAADCRDDVHTIDEGGFYQSTDSYLSAIQTGHYVEDAGVFGRWPWLVEETFGANTYDVFDDDLFMVVTSSGRARIAFPLYVSPHGPPP